MKEKPWESIAEKLMQDIKSGKLPPGEKMPSQNQLAGHYGVPRTHIRKAYEQLEELGYLFSHQGKGTFASLPPRMIPLAMELSGFAKKNGPAGSIMRKPGGAAKMDKLQTPAVSNSGSLPSGQSPENKPSAGGGRRTGRPAHQLPFCRPIPSAGNRGRGHPIGQPISSRSGL